MCRCVIRVERQLRIADHTTTIVPIVTIVKPTATPIASDTGICGPAVAFSRTGSVGNGLSREGSLSVVSINAIGLAVALTKNLEMVVAGNDAADIWDD